MDGNLGLAFQLKGYLACSIGIQHAGVHVKRILT